MKFLKSRISFVIGLMVLASQVAAAPVAAVTAAKKVVAPPTVDVLAKMATRIKQYRTVQMTGRLVFKPIPKDDPGNFEIPVQSISSGELTRIWKVVQKAGGGFKNKPKAEKLNGVAVYHAKAPVYLKGLTDTLRLITPFVDTESLSTAEQAALIPTSKTLATAEVNLYIVKANFVPTRLVVSWSSKSKVKVKPTTAITFDFEAFLDRAGNSFTTKKQPAAIPSGNEAQQANPPNPASDTSLVLPVATSTPPRAVDISGQGGVASPVTEDTSTVAGRDAQRLKDLTAIRTALELYLVDQGAYPSGSAIILGSAGSDCLNSDGWARADDCPYPYMPQVPRDPGSGTYAYTVVDQGMAYKVDAELEGSALGLRGKIALSPIGIVAR